MRVLVLGGESLPGGIDAWHFDTSIALTLRSVADEIGGERGQQRCAF